MQDLEKLDFYIMIENLKESSEEFKDYDTELLFKILNKTSLENKKGDDKELFLDENWKNNSKNMSNIVSSLRYCKFEKNIIRYFLKKK